MVERSSKWRIKIYKSLRTLELWDGNTVYASYPIGIGKNSDGHKKEEGDLRTPEGLYRVCVKNPKSSYYLSLGLNYPNNEDALSAIRDGRITREQYEEICRRNNNNEVPLWDTPLGGKVYLHGELEDRDWSEGCIRLYNKDIEQLFHLVEVGTSVEILP